MKFLLENNFAWGQNIVSDTIVYPVIKVMYKGKWWQLLFLWMIQPYYNQNDKTK